MFSIPPVLWMLSKYDPHKFKLSRLAKLVRCVFHFEFPLTACNKPTLGHIDNTSDKHKFPPIVSCNLVNVPFFIAMTLSRPNQISHNVDPSHFFPRFPRQKCHWNSGRADGKSLFFLLFLVFIVLGSCRGNESDDEVTMHAKSSMHLIIKQSSFPSSFIEKQVVFCHDDAVLMYTPSTYMKNKYTQILLDI